MGWGMLKPSYEGGGILRQDPGLTEPACLQQPQGVRLWLLHLCGGRAEEGEAEPGSLSVSDFSLNSAHLAVPGLAVKTPLKAVEAVEGGEVTFSVDLTVASEGEWFLDGEALKASSVYVIRCDRTRHMLTIREVPARLHGAQLKFVANGIETSIQMVVRGRPESPSSIFSAAW